MHEGFALFGHFGNLLFAHRAPQQIRAAEGVAGEQLRGLHHLLLINQNAIRLLGNLLEQWMFVANFHIAVAAFDEVGDEIHRPRPIQRYERGDMFHGTKLKFSAQIAHPARFQLEHAHRAAFV